MTSFLLYLFETGICLSILFLIYVFFFRKETYFNFNRVYLIGIMILALLVPVIHVTLHVNSLHYIEEPVADIARIRNFYTEIISSSDPEFQASPYIRYEVAQFEEAYNPHSDNLTQDISIQNERIAGGKVFGISLAKLLLWIYFGGLLFFLIRLSILTGWLFGIVRKNPKQKSKGYKLVLMEDEIPPFSFFSYIFINRNDTKLSEFEQILTHEKVHVMQKHSLDLFLAHAFSVFQWFNPLAWQMQKAIKTTHEYIADRHVVDKGYELFDYQSLLLKQLVSIRSVELVNNFNLLFIKKRIAMMKKNNSGFPAKLKAVVVIPAALLVFFLFADMTVKSPVFSTTNFGIPKTSNLDGIWINDNPNEDYALIQFEGNKLSILESLTNVNVRQLSISIKENRFVIISSGPESGAENTVTYEFVGEQLRIYWYKSIYSIYNKTDFKNSHEALRPLNFKNMNIPKAKVARALDQVKYIVDIYVNENQYVIGNKSATLETLKNVIESEINGHSILDRSFLTFKIHADVSTSMGRIHAITSSMRELNTFKIAYTSYPSAKVSDLQQHIYAIPMKLPPPDAKKVDKEFLGKRLFEFNAKSQISRVRSDFEEFIDVHPDYIACFNWQNSTKYEDYIGFIDMVFDVVYKRRDELAMEKHNMAYSKLTTEMQKEIRTVFPLRLTQINTDAE